MAFANQILVLTKHKDYDTTWLTEHGYVSIVRDAPVVEEDMASLGFCGANLAGVIYHEPTRMLTLGEVMYVVARIRRIKC